MSRRTTPKFLCHDRRVIRVKLKPNVLSKEMPAAIDSDTFTGNEIAVDQEQDCFGDFIGTAPPTKRCGFAHLGVLLRCQTWGLKNRPRRDRIDQNFWSKFQRKTFG